jgi:hypothetical protein
VVNIRLTFYIIREDAALKLYNSYFCCSGKLILKIDGNSTDRWLEKDVLIESNRLFLIGF